MRFEKFSFGSIRINGNTYEHDVVIDRGEVRKRKKKAIQKVSRQIRTHSAVDKGEDTQEVHSPRDRHRNRRSAGHGRSKRRSQSDVLVKSSPYAPGVPNWTATSVFDIGAYEYFSAGGYFSVDDVINDFTVTGAPGSVPLQISGVFASSLTSTGATINWTTTKPAASQVAYGTINNWL